MIPLYSGNEAQQWLSQHHLLSETHDPQVEVSVRSILQQVKTQGDEALRELAQRFGEHPPESFRLPDTQIEAACQRLSAETRRVLEHAAENIQAFAQGVMTAVGPVQLQRDGFSVGLDWKPVQRVGCYVPGGRYPLPSTALMTALTAQAAGVPQICIMSPQLGDAVIYAGTLAGVKDFYQVGGAQALAALAYGTASIPPVDMVVGPGNAYVTEAKRQLQGIIGIDMLAGPSEVAIIADAEANPTWVALDLLAQAEHDPNARAYCLTPSQALAQAVAAEVEHQYQTLQLPDFVSEALAESAILVLPSLATCVEAANTLAPEHLELQVDDPETLKEAFQHYGALFMGYRSTVPFGDYMAGPNHTLPTGRTARFSGSLNPMTFLRAQTWVQAEAGLQALATDTALFAHLEGLVAHGTAAQARLMA